MKDGEKAIFRDFSLGIILMLGLAVGILINTIEIWIKMYGIFMLAAGFTWAILGWRLCDYCRENNIESIELFKLHKKKVKRK